VQITPSGLQDRAGRTALASSTLVRSPHEQNVTVVVAKGSDFIRPTYADSAFVDLLTR
jgi:hypothetical protein